MQFIHLWDFNCCKLMESYQEIFNVLSTTFVHRCLQSIQEKKLLYWITKGFCYSYIAVTEFKLIFFGKILFVYILITVISTHIEKKNFLKIRIFWLIDFKMEENE